HQPGNLLGLGDVARQRLFTRDALQRALARADGVDDLLDVLDARMVGTAQPDGVDRGIGDHGGDALEGPGLAYAKVAREARGARGILWIGAPDAKHVGVADALPALDVKPRVEAGTDESNAETGV